MPHLISYVKNPVSYDQSGDRELYTVSRVGNLSGVSSGVGLLYYSIQLSENPVLKSQFVLLKSTPVEYRRTNADQASLWFDPSAKFPCSGFIARTGEGYIFAPAIKLAISLGSDIVLMLVSPARVAREVSPEKTMLSALGEEATVTLSAANGELRCGGSVSGRFKTARIVLNRNPRIPFYREGFSETLREVKEPGSISCVWKPVIRSFEEQLLVFHPGKAGYEIPADLRRTLGLTDEDTDYVIGDGEGVNYTIRLVIDRGLGRHSSDETALIVK